MILRATVTDKEAIINYINSDAPKVPYLASNLQHYGVCNEQVPVWIDVVDTKINAVYLLYHDCFHFYSQQDDYPTEAIVDFIKAKQPHVIMLQGKVGKRLTTEMELKKYTLTTELTLDHNIGAKHHVYDKDVEIVKDEAELYEVTKLLMCSNVFSSVYTMNSLYGQLKERYNDGYGVVFVVRRDNKIISSIAVTGETQEFIFTGCLVVHPEYRRMGYGTKVLNSECKYALDKGKQCYCLISPQNEKSINLHIKNGESIIGEIYKYTRN